MLTSASSARVLVAAFIAAQVSIGLTLPAGRKRRPTPPIAARSPPR